VDPPLAEEGSLPDEWYCNVCLANRQPAPHHGGAFGSLLNNLDKKNSGAFRLPAVIRDRFEGVRTGADGEYEDVVAPQPGKPK